MFGTSCGGDGKTGTTGGGGSSTQSSSSSGEGGTGGTGGFGCLGSEIVCDGSIAHACNAPASAGTDCASTGKVCAPNLGCVTCVPGSGTCGAAGATYCKKDGSGFIEFTCDADLGLSCQGTTCVGPCAPSVIEDSYMGCEYFPTTVINNVNNSYDFEVAVANSSASEQADVKVSGGGLAMPLSVTVAPGGVERIKLPWVDQAKVCNESSIGNGFDQINACSPSHNPDYSSRVVSKGAYRLASNRPVAVYQFAPIQSMKQGFQAGTTEAALLLPQTVFGHRYRVATFGQGFSRGAIAVVATVDGTTVTVHPTADVMAGGGNPSGIAAGQVGSYQANRGDVLEIISASTASNSNVGDLTGSWVEANHPVQVFGAHGCAWVIDTKSCDHLEDSMFPDAALGNDYLVKAPTYAGSTAYLVRVIAVEDNVTVSFDPAAAGPMTTLAKAGDVLDVSAADFAARITATGRIMVAGLNEGDNTLSLYVPTARFRSDYLFYVAEFQHNAVRIFAPADAGVKLDGVDIAANAWTPIGASGYSFAVVSVTSGPHRATGGKPFGLMVFGNQDAGYVPGGLPSAYEYAGGLDLQTTEYEIPK